MLGTQFLSPKKLFGSVQKLSRNLFSNIRVIELQIF